MIKNVSSWGERAMKKLIIAILLTATLTAWAWGSQVGGKITTKDKLELFYDACIEKLISNCQDKLVMRRSKHENIRRSAALYCLKAGFLRIHKSELIQDMLTQEVGTKQHQICYFLNERFFDVFRDAVRTVNLEYLLKNQD
jgi:hypothetical protein